MTSDKTSTHESTPNGPTARTLGIDRPIDGELFAWPEVALDPVSKMRAIAEALPYGAVRETVFDAPFDRVWDFISDLEHSTVQFERAIRRVEILEQSGESLRIRSRMITGFSIEFDVVLRPGWCVMNSRFGQNGMAARSEGEGRTRFIHFEGSPLLGKLLRPYFHWNIESDFKKLKALFA
jgi:hypothetical protein